jgi:hypothetical protein
MLTRPWVRRRGVRVVRWRVMSLMCAATLVVQSTLQGSDNVRVPIGLQAELIVKVAKYDRALPSRVVDGALRVAILTKSGNNDSTWEASQMKGALENIDRIAGYPHTQTDFLFTTGTALSERCRKEHFAIIYLTSGLRGDIAAIRTALDDVSVLTVSGVVDYVAAGVVLGFDSDPGAGRTKILVQLEQAKKQHVLFEAQLLNIATVYR